MSLRNDAGIIIKKSIEKVLPDQAVKEALQGIDLGTGRIFVVSVGKAGWQMAKAAVDILGDRITSGICVTKYDHVKAEIPGILCCEAGHPVPDEQSFNSTQKVLDLVSDLKSDDTVLFLLSGGGSALFEKPLISGEELSDITHQLLACGADIVEMNTIRKRLSAVKGGKFAKICEPASVYSIVLSDIVGDPLDMIASGPAYPDSSTSEQALHIVNKYHLTFSDETMELMRQETPKKLCNVTTQITGSVRNLCKAAADACEQLGYHTYILADCLECEAKEAGSFLAAIAKSHQNSTQSLAYIVGGETVVHLTGKGKGGRNQELVLSAANGIGGMENTAIFSIGSDGTDGPTDAAGGYCDGNTKEKLENAGVDIYQVLQDNDAYTALKKVDGLVVTGATGTNVNDVSVLLIRR